MCVGLLDNTEQYTPDEECKHFCFMFFTHAGLPGPGVLHARRDRRLPGKLLGETSDVSSTNKPTCNISSAVLIRHF